MNKATGIRGNGQARYTWKKVWKSETLSAEALQYMSELAQVRARLFDGKIRSTEKVQNLMARQENIIGILGDFHAVEISLPEKVGA